MDWMGVVYPWLVALHIISVIAWMAGLLYLPRLFVYHCETEPGSDSAERFKVMERRLLRLIMNPAMIGTWGFGIWLMVLGEWWEDGWMHVKLTAVVLLTIFHHLLGRWREEFAADRNQRPVRFYRIANEVPTVLMVAIVILVVVKPF